ncbi:hypothetical protein ACQKJZ_00045 [Sphingomonas sp. NPDC019816]|uniref:hypothetical protein n=1 Tax=Sphingomonas sp. NPDC019816 TaxID=3390679 RepID=UPI003D03AFE3
MTAMARIEHAPRSAPIFRHRQHCGDGNRRLTRVLTADAARAGCDIALELVAVEPWSSATFTGSVVTLSLVAPAGPALTRWLADLPEADLPMGRDLVADIAVERDAAGCRLRVLICCDAADG